MKFLKSLLKILLLFFLIIDLVLLGLVLNLKSTVKEVVTYTLKEGITTELVDSMPDDNNYDKETIKKEIEKLINENKEVQQIVDKYMDIAMEAISGKEINEKLDLAQDIDVILNESESILKQYNIVIDDETRNEIKELVASEEVTDFLNEGINTYKEKVPEEYKSAMDIFVFITSGIFKLVLIVSIVVIVGLIALLKKSTYKWLSNLGSASIISGVIILVIPISASYLPVLLNNDNISISLDSLMNYGLVSAILGMIEFIVCIVITKKSQKKQVQNIEID